MPVLEVHTGTGRTTAAPAECVRPAAWDDAPAVMTRIWAPFALGGHMWLKGEGLGTHANGGLASAVAATIATVSHARAEIGEPEG